MPRPLLGILLLVAVVLMGCGGRDTASGPPAAAVGLDAQGALHPSESDRCPVCAMTVADRPMVCGAETDDGRTYYFCGTGCLPCGKRHSSPARPAMAKRSRMPRGGRRKGGR